MVRVRGTGGTKEGMSLKKAFSKDIKSNQLQYK